MYNKVKHLLGIDLYMVGGSVRDEILGQKPKDYDFTTPLLPDEIESAVRKAGRKPYLIGKRFGTIGVKVDGQLVEITTFRSEKYESGRRKPNVEFVRDITADLSRRDFTINAIAKKGDRLIDPHCGRLDIMGRTIKAVGAPKQRFKEDPLRMLRAARFAAQLGFEVDQDTRNHITKMSHKILEVSRERWVMELDKLLMCAQVCAGLDILAETKLLNFIIPELSLQVGYEQNSPWHDLQLWEHTKIVIDNVPTDIELRWAALLHDIAKPFVRTDKPDRSNYIKHDLLGKEMALKVGMYLKWSNTRIANVAELVFNHLAENSPLRQADYIGKRETK